MSATCTRTSTSTPTCWSPPPGETPEGGPASGRHVTASGPPTRLPALREPAFRNLFAGQALSRLGDRIAPVALAFGVIDSGGSAADLGLVVAAGRAPVALFAGAAGGGGG